MWRPRFLVAAVALVDPGDAVEGWSDDKKPPSFLFILGDDIGWGDFGYNNGTALTPNINAWAARDGSILMQDFHSGGTVCSPTRATVLTGRNHFRDCVEFVYDCSDPTECTPRMNFAPRRTFTIADAARAAKVDMASMFFGKWHLGSFFNDSEARGGVTSSPITHGFDRMNATVEVTPTATTNCMCKEEWSKHCNLGHYHAPNHCAGNTNPGGPSLPKGCCFNYWREDTSSATGVSNMTTPVGEDDSALIAEAFDSFLLSRQGNPFLAQLSFHNCHIPYIGTQAAREACRKGETCRSHDGHGHTSAQFTDAQLDFFACLNELDVSVGKVLESLGHYGYYDNTMVWLTTDNGPEGNCAPHGFCTDSHYASFPGSSGPLRGRKRDIWEGGHRVPSIISWPVLVRGPARESWDLVVTSDFLVTLMDVLSVSHPAEQSEWPLDGRSILPILRKEHWPDRGVGWVYERWSHGAPNGYRYGKWKYVNGSTSCRMQECMVEQLFDLSKDLSETTDVGAEHPDVLAAIRANFTAWYDSVENSRRHESQCLQEDTQTKAVEGSACAWREGFESVGPPLGTSVHVHNKEECAGLCASTSGCSAVDLWEVRSNTARRTGVFCEEDLQSGDGLMCQMRYDGGFMRPRPDVSACSPSKTLSFV